MRARTRFARRDEGKILAELAERCGERLRRIAPARAAADAGEAGAVCDALADAIREAEAHAIRILLRRVGTRTTIARIRARGRE